MRGYTIKLCSDKYKKIRSREKKKTKKGKAKSKQTNTIRTVWKHFQVANLGSELETTKFYLFLNIRRAVKHDSSEKSKVFQALFFSKEFSRVGFYVQGTIIKLEFYAEMLKKRNSQNPVVQTYSCTILCCVLCTCSHLPHGLSFFFLLTGVQQEGSSRHSKWGKGILIVIKQWREMGFCAMYAFFGYIL